MHTHTDAHIYVLVSCTVLKAPTKICMYVCMYIYIYNNYIIVSTYTNTDTSINSCIATPNDWNRSDGVPVVKWYKSALKMGRKFQFNFKSQ